MTVSDLLEQPCNKSDIPSSLLQVVNSLFQTCYNWEQAVRTQLVDIPTCLQTCNNFCVFTDVFQGLLYGGRIVIFSTVVKCLKSYLTTDIYN
jgi:hypothetical protein